MQYKIFAWIITMAGVRTTYHFPASSHVITLKWLRAAMIYGVSERSVDIVNGEFLMQFKRDSALFAYIYVSEMCNGQSDGDMLICGERGVQQECRVDHGRVVGFLIKYDLWVRPIESYCLWVVVAFGVTLYMVV